MPHSKHKLAHKASHKKPAHAPVHKKAAHKPAPKPHALPHKPVVKKQIPVSAGHHVKVMTTNPVIIDHKRVTPSDYMMGADGSRIFVIEAVEEKKAAPTPKPVQVKTALVVVEKPKPKEENSKMKIFTDYPVIINHKHKSPPSYYLNATGDGTTPASNSGVATAGNALNALESAWQGVQNSGVLQNLKQGVVGTGKPVTTPVSANMTNPTPATAPMGTPPVVKTKKGANTGVIIGLVAGGLAIGVGIFLYIKHKNKK